MDELRPPTLLALPSYLAGHVARIGRRELAAALETQSLRLPHFAVLAGLSDFGPLAQHALADRLGLNRSHLVGYLDELECRELVGRERDPEDRRRQRVALTEDGKALAGVLKEEARRSQDVLLSELSEKERETLVSLLRRVVVADDRARSEVVT
ncbi:MarR family winged helix-turn-helix transcriptional regulator [Amycolatopsis nivea]|uniref:MarR family winged helix-turn-helix transcriptional regulator n=1 Tax=Amycolatopsis nivea TaxID=1644109 RepID=UPI00106F5D99|nr:MarR family transcriptional regulator [Amycolatopsis nivea]